VSRRLADGLRGVAAAVVLVVLLVGVPVFLVARVGWPLPSHVPRVAEVRDALTRSGVSDATVVKLVAVVVWFAWIQLALGVTAEALSVVRKRPVRIVPVLPSMRRGAGVLVGALVVLYTSVGSLRAASASRLAMGVPPRPPTAVVASAAPTAPVAAAGPTWTVRRRDTLWGIAEVALGRGERWREIQRLNAERAVAPGVVFAADQELIRPGWVLVLPAGADVPPAGSYRVLKGDTLGAIAARYYGDAAQWPTIWEANRGTRFGGRVFDDPNLILVGWDLVLPAVPDLPGDPPPPDPTPPERAPPAAVVADPPATVGEPPATVADPASSDPVASSTVSPTSSSLSPPPAATGPPVATPPPPSVDPPGATPAWVLPAGISGSALLATGAAGLLASRRRRRIERMAPGQTLPVPDPDLAPTDAAVRLGADSLGMARLDLALRALSAALPVDTVARPVAVRRGIGGELTVYFIDGPPDPPPRWEVGGPDALTLPAAVPIDVLAAGAAGICAPCPALVLIGCTDDAEIYLDIEAAGTVVVEGPTVVGQALARGVVATLAVSPIVDDLAVIAVGVDCYGFANERRITSTMTFADAARLALESTAPIRRQLEAGAASTFALRQRHPEEPWEPVVVVALRDRALRPDEVIALCGPGGRGIGVVTDVAVPSAVRLAADPAGRWHIEPFGWVVEPAGLAAQELADLGALLADALAAPIDLAGHVELHESVSPAVAPAAPWTLLVRLLGPVDVVDGAGRPASFSRSKSLELVVWLAEHRANPSRRAARTALWATDVRDATFANVVSEARRALAAHAAAPGDEEWIGRTGGDRLSLHAGVITDAELLAAALARARRLDGTEAVDVLRDGLGHVRDVPFSGTDYLWPDGEALPSNLVVLVTTAAAEMATLCLALGDAPGAFWATSQGLKVLPAHDELVCLRMETHAASGNAAGVRLEFEAYERALAADPWGDSEPSSKVLATRGRLLRSTSPR
jgi:LysM repeat protein